MKLDKLLIAKDKQQPGDYILTINGIFWNRYKSLETATIKADGLLRLRPKTATITIDLRG